MDRRRFLSLLGLSVAAAVAPTKAYSFLGGILRPRKALTIVDVAAYHNRMEQLKYEAMMRQVNPPLVCDWIDLDRLAAEIGGNLGIAPEIITRTKPFTDALNRRSLIT